MSTRVYVDTSAVAKLFIAERETSDLRQWLADPSKPHLVSSALLAVELLRLLRLVNPRHRYASGTILGGRRRHR